MNPPESKSRAARFQFGTPLQLTFATDETRARHYVRLIGFLVDRSLIVTTPLLNGKVMLVKEGQVVVVRMLTNNTVLGFSAEVLRSHLRPYAYLHLSYPQKMEEVTVRKAQRVNVQLIASVLNESDEGDRQSPRSAIIGDISTAGALVTADQPLGDVGDLVTVRVRLAFGQVEEYLTLPCVVRNVVEAEPESGTGTARWRHGLEFQMLEQNETMVLHGFVYEQIIRAMSS